MLKKTLIKVLNTFFNIYNDINKEKTKYYKN